MIASSTVEAHSLSTLSRQYTAVQRLYNKGDSLPKSYFLFHYHHHTLSHSPHCFLFFFLELTLAV